MKKLTSLTIAFMVLFVLIAPASAHFVVTLPGDTQNASINATADSFYYDVGDTVRLFLYIIHPADANFAEIADTFNMSQQVIYPNGTIAPVTLTRSAGNATYDIGNGQTTTANWYSSNITLDREGVYYVFSSQKGYDNNSTLTRERNSFTALYVGNSSEGWDNLQKLGHNTGANVTVYPTTDVRDFKSGSALSVRVDGNLSWYEQESENPAAVYDPLPVIFAEYTNPFIMNTVGEGIDIDGHVASNNNPVATATLEKAGVWVVVALNEEDGEDRDNFQAAYVMPVSFASGSGNESGSDSGDGDSSIPGVGFFGLIVCIALAGAFILRKK